MNQSIPQSYTLRSIICTGSHSNISAAQKNDTNEFVAIKSQPSYFKDQKSQNKRHGSHHSRRRKTSNDKDEDSPNQSFVSSNKSDDIKIVNKKSNLKREAKLYKMLAGAPGFPMYQRFITEGGTDHLILELLGPNLLSLIKENIQSDTSRLSLKTVLQFADQALLRLQYFHKKGYVHGDIKPDNFVIGKFAKSNQIYLIDMNLATRYINKKNGEHLPFSDKHNYQGSYIFSSINSQRGLKLSRRDDLESLGYVLVFLMHGSLPWSYCTSAKNALSAKINTPVKYLCEGLPYEFEQFINSTRCLSYSDEPDYSYYRQLFRDLFIKEGFIYDYVYDWSINDKYKTIISMSASFYQTNPQYLIKEIQFSEKNRKSISKSNTPYYESLVQLSSHQTADFEMVNCCHLHHNFKVNKQQEKAKNSQNATHEHKTLTSSIGDESNTQNQKDQNVQSVLMKSPEVIQSVPKSQNQSGNRSKRLILNIRGNFKNSSRNQSSG